VHASESYVYAALKLTPEQRAAVLAGERPLIAAPARPVAGSAWEKVDPDKITALIRSIGVDRAIDAAIKVEAEAVT
jgi:hypothetical protein